MTTYAIGDLQGCLAPLHKLLDRLRFDPALDTLWFVGDLVNRGPESLQTLRFVKSLGKSAISVLGNHDLHLLAIIYGIRKPSDKDTLDDILKAPDLQELTDWLRSLPLMHIDDPLKFVLVHAGVYPLWDINTASTCAKEVEQQLRADDVEQFLHRMYGNKPTRWSTDLGKTQRRRFTVNAFTRMRFCDKDGAMDFSCSGPPAKASRHLLPWYNVPGRMDLPYRVLFGHWSSHPGFAVSNVIPLDRGCVWGGNLCALALETDIVTTLPCSS